VPYTEGTLKSQLQAVARARQSAVSGITAILGVTLFVQEVQRIRAQSSISFVDYEYLALLAVTGSLVFLWIWASEDEIGMLGKWLDPEDFSVPSSFQQLATIMSLAALLVCLFFAARDIRWYATLFLFYIIFDFLMLRYVHSLIRQAVKGSYKRLSEENGSATHLYVKAIKQIELYYFGRPHDLRRFSVFLAMAIACSLAYSSGDLKGDLYVWIAYGLSIATIIASEVVIGYWRQARDNALSVIDAELVKIRRETDGSASLGTTRRRAS